jgi:hypothetical protein
MNMRNRLPNPDRSEANKIKSELRAITLDSLPGSENINEATFSAAINMICRYVQGNGRVPDSVDELPVKSNGRQKEVARKVLEFYSSSGMNPVIMGAVAFLEVSVANNQAAALDNLGKTSPNLGSGRVYNRLCRYVKTRGSISKLSDLGSWQPNTLAEAKAILDAAKISYEE